MSDTTASESPKKAYSGSCMCKKVRYTVQLALADPPCFIRCNCTFCTKSGFDSANIKSLDFHLQAPCSTAEATSGKTSSRETLGRFCAPTSPTLFRYFCDKCGNQIFVAGTYYYEGRPIEHFSINIKLLDQPQEGLDLSKFKFEYYDGLSDKYMEKKTDGPYPGGLV
ncbi:hypothetical protein CAC42_5175 [Sphaceloma murrayae]|uniref:CENP-V/GFA domain-containing protein n=1 Tax=Sphaceloma murrayae TaxID=2082308 RepID=A0A2K1QUA1_9PEZI|nr:hypothetical protein CAC42_5175 [Sphaceloma murrayae]